MSENLSLTEVKLGVTSGHVKPPSVDRKKQSALVRQNKMNL